MAMHWMLEKFGHVTQLVPHRHSDIDIDKFPPDRYEAYFRWLKSYVGQPELLVVSYPPDIAARMGETKDGLSDGVHDKIVPYCAYEGVGVSEYVVGLCNKMFAQVWTVSPFVSRALIDSGVKPELVRTIRPVLYEGPWGSWPTKEYGGEIAADKPFRFGMMGTWQERKGVIDLVRGYWSSFKRSDPVVLCIRTSPIGDAVTLARFEKKVIADLAKLADEFGDFDFPASKKQARIIIETGTSLTDAEVIDWIGDLDCYVNASYGEGLGIPAIWAKTFGIPMVSTAFGAVGELLAEVPSSVDKIVSHKLAPVGQDMQRFNLMFGDDSMWARYDPIEFGAAMRAAFDANRQRSVSQAMATRNAFHFDACSAALRTALGEVCPSLT
jgi:glycosyltransferase involved in cell wall biosynthesis